MKILGLGIPELVVIGIVLVPILIIVVIVVVIISQSKKPAASSQQPHTAETRNIESGDSEKLVMELRELKELLDLGILTKEEFESKKSDCLKR